MTIIYTNPIPILDFNNTGKGIVLELPLQYI